MRPGIGSESSQTSVGVAPVILLVDDDQSIRGMLDATLKKAGFLVVPACDGQEAIALLRNTARVNLVLSDIEMPGLSGMDVAAFTRHNFPALPILLMSGSPPPPGMAATGCEFLPKPFLLDSLVNAAKRLTRAQDADAYPISARA